MITDKDIIFLLQVENVQNKALLKLRCELTEEELYGVKKRIGFGLEYWPEVVRCAINDLNLSERKTDDTQF